MDEYYGYDLDSFRGLSTLEFDIAQEIIDPKVAADLLRGHPCEDEFLERFPELRSWLQEPPDDDSSPST